MFIQQMQLQDGLVLTTFNTEEELLTKLDSMICDLMDISDGLEKKLGERFKNRAPVISKHLEQCFKDPS